MGHRHLAATVAVVLSVLGGAFARAQAQDLPDPSQTYISAFNVLGGGCPPNTVATNLSPDRQALTLLYANFAVQGGRQLGTPVKETACAVRMRVHVPAGYSFSVMGIDTQGYASLNPNTFGYARTEFRWGDSVVGLVKLSEERIKGPSAAEFVTSSRLPMSALAWSPCTGQDQLLVLRTTIGVNGQRGYITVDQQDAVITQKYALSWRRCSDQGRGVPVKGFATTGFVRRDTSLCLNHTQGVLTVSSAAPEHPGEAFARLQHNMVNAMGTNVPLNKDSYNVAVADVYRLPGDWNSIAGVVPNPEAKATVNDRKVVTTVDTPAPDVTCVRFLNAPAQITIHWRPRQR